MKQIKLFKKIAAIFAVAMILITSLYLVLPAEGMYPLSEISNLDLVDAGLKIDPNEVYNPDGVSLIDALVNVGGCTGSFVSPDGLIITNHHCAFGAINRASTPEKNYLENGFLAETREMEIPATGTRVKITESYEDVSDMVLGAASGIEDPVERIEKIKEKVLELEKEATDEENSIEAQVSEMFTGKTYILFKYRIIEDVRLVYAPPRTIGNFGGESDNWVWPRHTGDFTFMRAYVAADGSAAEYSEDNVPYKPKKHLTVNPKGVNEDDFVFILGYPARTYRHKSSFFLEYQRSYQLPFIQDLFADMIELTEAYGEGNVERQLKYATFIKRLSNTEKNYRGKMRGIRRLGLVDKKRAEEAELMKFVNADPKLKEQYGNVLNELEEIYNVSYAIGHGYLWTWMASRYSNVVSNVAKLQEYATQLALPEDQREKKFDEDGMMKAVNGLQRWAESYDAEFERKILAKLIEKAINFEGESEIRAIKSRISSEEEITALVDRLLKDFAPGEDNPVYKLASSNADDILKYESELFEFVKELTEQDEQITELYRKGTAKLNKVSAKYTEAKKAWVKTDFVPDANRTLRLTYGYIKGYSPADAVYYSPVTMLDGVIDKSYMGGDYEIPAKLKELYDVKDYGQFKDEESGSVPVAILYNTDTSGGNSGSPILDAYGNLIGVNFDRAFDATINDYAWDDAYSRSIGVDIRYVLWVTQKFGGAGFLLEEMGVKLN